MRLHLLGLPHTQTTSEYLTCAYTQKVVKFGKMMTQLGHEVIIYAGEENEAICAEHVPIITEAERHAWFGTGFDTALTPFEWDVNQPYWRAYNERAAAEVLKRANPRDLLLLTTSIQKPVYDVVRHAVGMTGVEWGVGYQGVWLDFAVFESYAWMHHVYGLQDRHDGKNYDAVVPNFFDRFDFRVAEKKDDYLLYVGRMIRRKGVLTAALVAERMGMRLIAAGPGGSPVPGGVKTVEHDFIPGVEYVGPVGPDERSELMSKARALLAPTTYIEPFGGVAVEAMMSGTPAVTTDWGAFTETVVPGVTGYRFRTIHEGADAVERAMELDKRSIREEAVNRWSLETVGLMYEEHFGRLDSLWEWNWDGTPVGPPVV